MPSCHRCHTRVCGFEKGCGRTLGIKKNNDGTEVILCLNCEDNNSIENNATGFKSEPTFLMKMGKKPKKKGKAKINTVPPFTYFATKPVGSSPGKMKHEATNKSGPRKQTARHREIAEACKKAQRDNVTKK